MGAQHHGLVFRAPPGARPVSQQVSGLVRRHFDADVGMLGVGILGGPWLGYVQNSTIESALVNESVALEQVLGEERSSLFGPYRAIDQDKLDALGEAGEGRVEEVRTEAKATALRKVVILPTLMLVFYLALMVWNRGRGGYQPVQLDHG